MTVVIYPNNLYTCLSTDTKPTTNVIPFALLIVTDTSALYWYNGTSWALVTGGAGEANTASNVGAGQGVFKAKTGIDLAFRSLTATSSKIALANNTNDVGIDVTEANLTHDNIGGTLGVAKGGTGATTLTGVLKGNGTGAFTALTDPLPIANGGTSGATAAAGFDALSGLTTLGDLLYGGASGTRTRLAGNLTQARKLLTQTGTGAASAAPAWAVDPYFPSSGRKAGRIIPTVTPATLGIYGDGLLSSPVTVAGSPSFTISTVADGGVWVCQTAASAASNAGFRVTANLFMRGLNPRLKTRFKMDSLTAAKLMIGFRVSGAAPSTDDPSNGSSCAMFGFSSTISATNWITWTNNGSGATETTDTTIAADTSYHTIEIVAVDGSSKFTYSLDEAAPVDMISTIPAQTTLLTPSFYNITTEAVAKNLTMTWMEVEQDK